MKTCRLYWILVIGPWLGPILCGLLDLWTIMNQNSEQCGSISEFGFRGVTLIHPIFLVNFMCFIFIFSYSSFNSQKYRVFVCLKQWFQHWFWSLLLIPCLPLSNSVQPPFLVQPHLDRSYYCQFGIRWQL